MFEMRIDVKVLANTYWKVASKMFVKSAKAST